MKSQKPKKKVQRCRACGEKDDHTAKNCPYKPIPADVQIGPTKLECGCFLGGCGMENVSDALVQSSASTLKMKNKKQHEDKHDSHYRQDP